MTKRMQEIAEQLAADRSTLLSSIANLDTPQYQFREAEGRWTIAEILEHLAVSHESMGKAVRRLARMAESKGEPCTEDTSVINCIDRNNLAVPRRKRQAPDFVLPSSKMPVAEALSRLEASRTQLLELLPSMARFELSEVKTAYPLLGDLNAYQWILMIGIHEVRHAAQISAIRSTPAFPAPGQ